ncbi:MAG TPA: hypothetical protein VF183_06715 [Acidimicrobiales bacterium]
MTDGAERPRRRVPTWLLAGCGVLLGAALGLLLSTVIGDDDEPDVLELTPVESPYPADQAANADAFLQAWERYRNATFRAELTFVRETPDGRRLELERLVVQQPPRRAVRQLDDITAVEDGETLVCSPRDGDRVCFTQEGSDYAAAVESELAAWRSATSGEAPFYAVHALDGGCFELRLARELPEPPYGEITRVCFDEATGALRNRQVIRTTGTDTEEATTISGTVTDEDWQAVGA